MRNLFEELRNELDLKNRCEDFFDISFELFSRDGRRKGKPELNLFDFLEQFYSHDESGFSKYNGTLIYKIKSSGEREFTPLPSTEKELIKRITGILGVDYPWWALVPNLSRRNLDIVLYVLCSLKSGMVQWLEEVFKFYGRQEESLECLDILKDVIATVALTTLIQEDKKKYLMGLLGYTHKCVFVEWFKEKKENREVSEIEGMGVYSKVFAAGRTLDSYTDAPLVLWRKDPRKSDVMETSETWDSYKAAKGCRIILFNEDDKALPYYDGVTYRIWQNEQEECEELEKIRDRRKTVRKIKLWVEIPTILAGELIFMVDLIKEYPLFFKVVLPLILFVAAMQAAWENRISSFFK